MKLAEILKKLDTLAPLHLAENWDNVGLLAGDRDRDVYRILFCIDCTEAVLEEAVAVQAQLVVAYHPPLFKPVSRITSDGGSKLIYHAIRQNIALYSPHTALDVAQGGTNDCLADLVGLDERDPLRPITASTHVKLVVFVPKSNLEAVSNALYDAGAGELGNYSRCSFSTTGRGTFMGNSQSHPVIGQPNKVEIVEEARFETLAPINKLPTIIAALRKAHPYEEPAFDIFPLAGPISDSGIGRIGDLAAPIDRAILLKTIADRMPEDRVLVAGPVIGPVRRIAVAAGSGGELLEDAIAKKAELFLTGELRHHDALRAASVGMTVVCTLHSNSERIVLKPLAGRLADGLSEVECIISKHDRDPFSIR